MDVNVAEQLIAELWSDVLGESVSPEDDFFGLGGNSLQMTQMLWTVEARSGVKISIVDFLEDPTPRALARFCLNRADAERP